MTRGLGNGHYQVMEPKADIPEGEPVEDGAPGAHDHMPDDGDVDFADGPVALHTVRWRPMSKQENQYVAPAKAKLLRTIRRRDVNKMKMALKHTSVRDIHNVSDEYGVSALEHAVRSGSTAIVDQLLAVCTNSDERSNAIERALLFAIKTNDVSIANHLIELHISEGFCRRSPDSRKVPTIRPNSGHSDVVFTEDKDAIQLRVHDHRKWSKPRSLSTSSVMDETEFSQEMTPIVMAAQLERTEIMRMLIDRCCPDIHPLTCVPTHDHHKHDCYICKESVNFVGQQTIEECRKAIEVYKALSSPAYMFQAGVDDPILEAFIISDIMERRKQADPAFVNDYDDISRNCQKLAVDFLSLCRTCSETTALLSHDAGIEATHGFHQASFPRLMVAAHYHQKEFIAHANCQQVLQNLWYTGLPEWVCQTSLHQVRAVTYACILGILMPFILLLYMFRAPYVDRFVRPAVSKFIFDIFSYTVFLGLLFLNSLLDKDHLRGASLTSVEIVILIYVIGYMWRFVRQTIRRRGQLCGSYRMSNSSWQFYELIMLLLFLVYFILKIYLWVLKTQTSQPIIVDRRILPWHDTFLWCEAIYACACTLAVAQLYSFFKASSVLGPLQISMKSMVYDVGPFLLLFSIVLAAFAIGLHSLYAGYSTNLIQVNLEKGRNVTQPDAFLTLAESFKTLFWDLFGYGSEDKAEVVVGNVNVSNKTGTGRVAVGEVVHHRLTEGIGYILYGIYHITVIIVLLNMVIAMMANSYNRIERNAVTEWRFARTRLIMAYINELGVLAPPFNILPFRWILGKIFGSFKKSNCCIRKTARPESVISYPELIEKLSKRYWRTREGEARHPNSHRGSYQHTESQWDTLSRTRPRNMTSDA